MPEVIVSSTGKTGDITAGKAMELPLTLKQGSIVVFDRAYIDYGWWDELNENGIYFVSRVKTNTAILVMGQHDAPQGNILADDKVLIGENNGYS